MKQMLDYRKLTEEAFEKVKSLRDHADDDDLSAMIKPALESKLFDFGGKDHGVYQYIIEEAKRISCQMVLKIVSILFSMKGETVKTIGDRKGNIHCFIVLQDETEVMYVFKEFGIDKRKTNNVQKEVIKNYSVKRLIYVSLVWDYAYLEAINHNDDLDDPTRGTACISLKDFFISFFGQEEFSEFEKNISKYTNDVSNYIGLFAIKTLRPSEMFRFKQKLETDIVNYNYENTIDDGISQEQLSIIREQFIEKGLYRSLIGRLPFAESFVTSEWLYSSFKAAGRIDYTVVALGYFKSIEQMLYQYIVFHTEEGRTIKRKRRQEYVSLSDESIKKDEIDTTIGAMVNSFYCFPKNGDLFNDEISSETKGYIRQVFREIMPLRNGYSHKDNLEEWEQVEKARKYAYLVALLLLGAFKYKDIDYEGLKLHEVKKTDYDKLRVYINDHPRQLYFVSDNDQSESVMCVGRVKTDYNHYGECEFGCIYLQPIGNRNKFIVDQRNLPNRIEAGDIDLRRIFDGKEIRLDHIQECKKTLIFENGVFCYVDT